MTIPEIITALPLSTIQIWGYLIFFIIIILDSVPPLGMILHAQLIVIFGGVLASLGVMGLPQILFISILGALLGDIIAYYLGRKYGRPFMLKYGRHFFFAKKHMKRTEKLMDNHLGKTLIVGRFLNFLAIMAPVIAGVAKIKFSKFLFYDSIGAIIWGSLFVGIGYLFGSAYERATSFLNFTILVVLGALISFFFVYRYFLRKYEK